VWVVVTMLPEAGNVAMTLPLALISTWVTPAGSFE
jgi:hypothetical protein